jgi:acetylornithine deacetylase
MSSEAVRDRFETALKEIEWADPWLLEHPIGVEWYGGQFESVEVAPTHPAFVALQDSHASEFGRPPELDGAPYGSDMRLLVHQADTPAILYGPGDIRRAHKANERISIDDIAQGARVVTAAVARYLVGEGGSGER